MPTPQESANIIKKWLHSCLGSHTTCKASATLDNPKPLPKRVLNVSDNKVMLVETGLKEDLYVALSHCWGIEQLLTTTRDTIANRMAGIDLQDMPKTFRDAVTMTRALGLRYIWIDSLCIIQGDAKDWKEQAAVMGDIYAGSYLNIAATRSAGGSEGFLSSRWTSRDSLKWARRFVSSARGSRDMQDISRIRKCDVESYTVARHGYPAPYGETMKVRLSMNSSHEAMQTFRWIRGHEDTAPLIQRGWVYQERNLSPRTVHFHSNEMVWDCADAQCCECAALDGGPIGGDGWSASKSRMSNLPALHVGDGWQLHGLWRTIVEDYCYLDLTYESDRLPALAGLATKFAEYMPKGHTYYVGMWERSLARDLLWSIDYLTTNRVNCRRMLGDRAPPTWSWASLPHGKNGPRLMWEYETKPKLTRSSEAWSYEQDPRFCVVSCSIDAATPFGVVSGGRLTVRGAMCALAVSGEEMAAIERSPVWPSSGPPEGFAHLITQNSSAFNSLHLHYDDPRDEKLFESIESPTNGFIFCLFVGTLFSHFDHDPDSNHPGHRGLILKPSVATPGSFERIGSWIQYVEHWAHGAEFFEKDATLHTLSIV
jgi:hypothetical protein